MREGKNLAGKRILEGKLEAAYHNQIKKIGNNKRKRKDVDEDNSDEQNCLLLFTRKTLFDIFELLYFI